MAVACAVAGSELWWLWHSRRRTAGERSRTGEGGEQRVESARAGAGAGEEVERQWAALAVGSRGEQRSRAGRQRKKKRGGGSEGLVCKNIKSKDLTVK
jgi:hypothetical protein